MHKKIASLFLYGLFVIKRSFSVLKFCDHLHPGLSTHLGLFTQLGILDLGRQDLRTLDGIPSYHCSLWYNLF